MPAFMSGHFTPALIKTSFYAESIGYLAIAGGMPTSVVDLAEKRAARGSGQETDNRAVSGASD
jgi:hypothetical protein